MRRKEIGTLGRNCQKKRARKKKIVKHLLKKKKSLEKEFWRDFLGKLLLMKLYKDITPETSAILGPALPPPSLLRTALPNNIIY